MVLVAARGVWTSFIDAIPSFPFNSFFSLEVFTIVDEMFWDVAMVAAFLICLSVFYNPCQMNHKLLCYPFNSTGIVILLILIIATILFF